MQLITSSIDYELKNLIIHSYNHIETKLNQKNDRTHHLNIYHTDWGQNDQKQLKILELLQNLYEIPSQQVISLGFISSQPDCKDQHFHIDYKGSTNTYFIPLCNLTDKNGTEYLEFDSPVKNISLFRHIKEIGDRFISREGVSGYLSSIGVLPDEYTFKILNTSSFSLVYLPNYVLHKGTKNKEDYIKVMFQIITKAVSSAKVSSKIEHQDSELDEDDNIVNILISSRKENEK